MPSARIISVICTAVVLLITVTAVAGERPFARSGDGVTIEPGKAVNGEDPGGANVRIDGADGEEKAAVSLGLFGMNRKMKKIPDLETGMNIPLWPIYNQARNELKHSTTVLWPLFHSEKSKYGESFTYSFPLFWHSRGRDDERSTFLLPLYYGSDDGGGNGSTCIVPPLFTKTKRATDDVQYGFMYPLFGWRTAPGRRQYDVFPLFYRRLETGETRPFFQERESVFGTSFAQPPEFMRDLERDNYFILFPFFWHLRTNADTYTHFWPLFGYDTFGQKGKRYSFLFPLFFYKDNPEQGVRWLLLFPFNYMRQESFDALGRKHEAKTVGFFPVFQYTKTPSATAHSLIGVYSYKWMTDREKKNSGEFSLFMLLYRKYWTDKSSSQWFAAPLFRYMRDDSDKWKSFSFLAFPYAKRFPSTRRLHLFGFGSKKDDFFLEFHPLFQYKVTNGLSRFHILYGFFGLYKEKPAGKPGAEPVRRWRLLWFINF